MLQRRVEIELETKDGATAVLKFTDMQFTAQLMYEAQEKAGLRVQPLWEFVLCNFVETITGLDAPIKAKEGHLFYKDLENIPVEIQCELFAKILEEIDKRKNYFEQKKTASPSSSGQCANVQKEDPVVKDVSVSTTKRGRRKKTDADTDTTSF